MKTIKAFGYDKLARAVVDKDNYEYILGIIDTINELDEKVENAIRVPEVTEEVKPEEPMEQPEPVKKPAAKKKPSKGGKAGMPKKNIDMGKVGALRKAGWSWAKIGDEFSVSATTVMNHGEEYQNSIK